MTFRHADAKIISWNGKHVHTNVFTLLVWVEDTYLRVHGMHGELGANSEIEQIADWLCGKCLQCMRYTAKQCLHGRRARVHVHATCTPLSKLEGRSWEGRLYSIARHFAGAAACVLVRWKPDCGWVQTAETWMSKPQSQDTTGNAPL